MKKLLVLTSTFPRWEKDATPAFVFDLSGGLANNFEVYVLAPHAEGTLKREEMGKLKARRFQYFWPAKWQKVCYEGGIMSRLRRNKWLIFQLPFLLVFFLWAAIRIARKEKIDLIHAHWIFPGGLTAVLCKKFFNKNIKIVCTSHGSDAFGLKPFSFLKRWVLNNIDALTVVSQAVFDEVSKLKLKKELEIKIIPMGADDKEFSKDRYDEGLKIRYGIRGPFLLFVGRLEENKGVEFLLRALPGVIKRNPLTKLLIVGEGSQRDSLEKTTRDLGINGNVEFLGALPNNELPKYYATADMLIGPSVAIGSGESEGFGLVFVEAQLSKTLAISSDLKSISDIIKNGETGIQVNVKDADVFSKKINYLIENQPERNRLAENGYNFSKNNFTWDIIAKKYLQLLNQLSK